MMNKRQEQQQQRNKRYCLYTTSMNTFYTLLSLKFIHLSTFLLLLFLHSPTPTLAKKVDRNIPHGHYGLIEKYTPGPFGMISLDNNDETNLSKGQPIMKQIPSTEGGEQGGKAICVQDIAAPSSAVWNQILDLDRYKGKVSKVGECKNYVVKANKEDGTVQIKTKMVLNVLPGYSFENYYDHKYHPNRNSITWSLDYEKTSDFDDVAGHWHVQPHPSKPGNTRVFYACDLKFKRAMPKPIMSILSKAALKKATSWVKKESESHPDADIPEQFVSEIQEPSTEFALN